MGKKSKPTPEHPTSTNYLGSSPLQYETNPQAKAQLLQKRFFSLPPDADLLDIIAANYPTPIKVDQITITEVHQAIMRPAPFKASGPTLIPNIILQHLAPILSPLLQRIFNSSLELGYCAKLFRNSVTISMQKPHKDDQVKSYRPIALLDTIAKVLESILRKKDQRRSRNSSPVTKNTFWGKEKYFNRTCSSLFGRKNICGMGLRTRSFRTNVGCNGRI